MVWWVVCSGVVDCVVEPDHLLCGVVVCVKWCGGLMWLNQSMLSDSITVWCGGLYVVVWWVVWMNQSNYCVVWWVMCLNQSTLSVVWWVVWLNQST